MTRQHKVRLIDDYVTVVQLLTITELFGRAFRQQIKLGMSTASHTVVTLDHNAYLRFPDGKYVPSIASCLIAAY